MDRWGAEEHMHLYLSKVFDTVSVDILMSKVRKTDFILWAQNWLDNHTIEKLKKSNYAQGSVGGLP